MDLELALALVVDRVLYTYLTPSANGRGTDTAGYPVAERGRPLAGHVSGVTSPDDPTRGAQPAGRGEFSILFSLTSVSLHCIMI
jgi:hypothetical protein